MTPDPADAAALEIETTYNYNYIEVKNPTVAPNGIMYPVSTVKTFTPDTSFTQRLI
jgi:hypothetical protein